MTLQSHSINFTQTRGYNHQIVPLLLDQLTPLCFQISLVDTFTHPKKQQTSHCYRIVYRHMEKTLTQEEVNVIHRQIEKAAALKLNVSIR
jgi:phenylalanyl-tRNA synthetase beta subunit